MQKEEDALDGLPDLDSDEEDQPVSNNQDGSAGGNNSTATQQGEPIEVEQKPSAIAGSSAEEVELTASPAPK